MNDKCEWKDGIFKPCDNTCASIFMLVDGRPIIKYGIAEIDIHFCPLCGVDIRKPEPKQLMTCDSECGMRMKYPDSCGMHACKYIRPDEPKQPTHEEIMTKWWKWGSTWHRVLAYQPNQMNQPYTIICGEDISSYSVKWFIDRVSRDIPEGE